MTHDRGRAMNEQKIARDPLSGEELEAVKRRAFEAPGSGVSADRYGSPLIHKSYGAILVDLAPGSRFWRVKPRKPPSTNLGDTLAYLQGAAEEMDVILRPAYQAEEDRARLLATVAHLEQQLQVAKSEALAWAMRNAEAAQREASLERARDEAAAQAMLARASRRQEEPG